MTVFEAITGGQDVKLVHTIPDETIIKLVGGLFVAMLLALLIARKIS